MNMATASGRSVHPENFEREILLRFNLPPLHILAKSFIPQIVKEETEVKKKEFIWSGDSDFRQLRK